MRNLGNLRIDSGSVSCVWWCLIVSQDFANGEQHVNDGWRRSFLKTCQVLCCSLVKRLAPTIFSMYQEKLPEDHDERVQLHLYESQKHPEPTLEWSPRAAYQNRSLPHIRTVYRLVKSSKYNTMIYTLNPFVVFNWCFSFLIPTGPKVKEPRETLALPKWAQHV